jgi:hypothetical protein
MLANLVGRGYFSSEADGDSIREPLLYVGWGSPLCPPHCEVYDPTLVDSDKDGVVDAKDNCPNVANANQQDRDHDGIGDVCRPSTTGGENAPPALTPNKTNEERGTNEEAIPQIKENVSELAPEINARGDVGADVLINNTELRASNSTQDAGAR